MTRTVLNTHTDPGPPAPVLSLTKQKPRPGMSGAFGEALWAGRAWQVNRCPSALLDGSRTSRSSKTPREGPRQQAGARDWGCWFPGQLAFRKAWRESKCLNLVFQENVNQIERARQMGHMERELSVGFCRLPAKTGSGSGKGGGQHPGKPAQGQGPALGRLTQAPACGGPQGDRGLGQGRAEPRRRGGLEAPFPSAALPTASFLVLPS